MPRARTNSSYPSSLGKVLRSNGRGLGSRRACSPAVGPALRLGNCPFHPYAAKAPDLVCAINHAFLTGFLDGIGATTVQAFLLPRPGACCVELAVPGPPGAGTIDKAPFGTASN
jgi:hypothetical protein